MRAAKLGVLLDDSYLRKEWSNDQNIFSCYIEEVLSHAGLTYTKITSTSEIQDSNVDILIVSAIDNSEKASEEVFRFVEQGGNAIVISEAPGLAQRLGFKAAGDDETGYAHFSEMDHPLRFLRNHTWIPKNTNYLYETAGFMTKDSPSGEQFGPARLMIQAGQGVVDKWNVDVLYTIVALQQGKEAVTKDGIPAPDGSANLDEGILKADDGFQLDWEYDRKHTETGIPYFAYPYADNWRELLIQQILNKALDKDLTLPLIGYWPDGIEAVAMISHDSDGNDDQSAEITLDLLKEGGVQSTWCMLEPGYSPYIYDEVKKEGHELAFHYNGLESQVGIWSKEEFKRQLTWMKMATGESEVCSNKNHYTRFQGWGEFYSWCEENGIQADQTRGPSKKGNIGFLFGTCHPFYPIAQADEKNRMYDVLQMGMLTQDLGHFNLADETVIEPFLSEVKKVGGIAHFLFHQIHFLQQEAVRTAFKAMVKKAKEQDFVFWTGKQINDWERMRRKLKVTEIDLFGNPVVEGPDSDSVVVWVPVKIPVSKTSPLTRFGVHCEKRVIQVKKFVS
jgi:hypothetical protein